ncbi:uncharacterized protein LOC125031471 [Penaeus chinensis]|uniref:uncharacterized protein LOC125031471 n=1 Tax=Penaeus chinensis TaxID=139456 RepID=UPI001FB78D3A|nr:uncharacterized protein LOC125031471 [Penaeus chinensis]XP_047478226.1 uncharacterized protein LOC125031471 [Penaeus chinensis]
MKLTTDDTTSATTASYAPQLHIRMHDQERHHLFVVHRAARKRFEFTAMERRYLLLFVAFAVGVAEGRWMKGKYSECFNEFNGTEGVITNADLTTDATCKAVIIMVDAGEPVTFTCSEFNFNSGNNSYCMIVSTKKGKKGKRGNGKGGNNKDNDDPQRPRRGGRSVGDGTDEETAQGLLANALLRGSLSQHFLNREKRHRKHFGGDSMENGESMENGKDSMENGKESMEAHGVRRRGGWRKGKGKRGQKFCDDAAPTNVEISKGTAKIMLVPNRKGKFRGANSTPVLDVVAFECSWGPN